MGEYINKYANSAAIQNAVDGGELIKPYVALDESTGLIDWNSKKANYSKMYFTVEALSDGDFIVRNSGLGYSINNGEWQTTSANPTTLALSTGDKVRFKGSVGNGNNLFSGNTLQFNVIGNIMSLKYGDNFSGQTTEFLNQNIFRGCTGLTDASNLILPATTLAYGCYQEMFANCRSLTTAPELPATTLRENCYMNMFAGCASLTTAPSLPATTLASGCCTYMFAGCTSLTTAPELPATTLRENCYQEMFSGCTSLTTAPELPATTLAGSCYRGMFSGCTSLTTAPELPVTTLAYGCYQEMFAGCTSLTTAPALPATTLVGYCYSSMFYNCTSLTKAPELPATTLTSYCYQEMFRGCTKLNYIKCLATDISASNCTKNWVYNVTSTGTFVTPSSTAWTTSYYGIPNGWTRVDA